MASNVNTLSIDVNGLWMAIQRSCLALLNDVAERVVQEFGPYIYKEGAGRHEWRANAAQEFQKISEKMTDELIEVEVGLREGLEEEAWGNIYAAQVMVALFGNHPPIETKPGMEVFKDHMLSRGTSNAETVYEIPQFGWVDPGADKMVGNALKNATVYFRDGLQRVLSDINFYDYVYVN